MAKKKGFLLTVASGAGVEYARLMMREAGQVRAILPAKQRLGFGALAAVVQLENLVIVGGNQQFAFIVEIERREGASFWFGRKDLFFYF